jgi:biotin transporter BioY
MFQHYLPFQTKPSLSFFTGCLISILLLCSIGPLVLDINSILSSDNGQEALSYALYNMPFALTTVFAVGSAIWFGWAIGFTSILIYIGLGLAGLPVFQEYKGGLFMLDIKHIGELGELFGMLASALLTGYINKGLPKYKSLYTLFLWTFGHAIILVFSSMYYYRLQPEMAWPFVKVQLGSTAIKIAMGTILTLILLRIAQGRKSYYNQEQA